MTLRLEELMGAVRRNDVPAVVAQLRGCPESERKAAAPEVRAVTKDAHDFRGSYAAAAVALLGTAAGVRQVATVLGRVSLGDWHEAACMVLADRAPAWTGDLPAALLTGGESRNQWRLVRAMVRARLIPAPELPEYTVQMPAALSPKVFLTEQTGPPVEQQLLADPGLLEDEIFRLFRVEGAARALYWQDGALAKRGGGTWAVTLARLARTGKIDFDRLLQECVGAFSRDFRPAYLGWYATMHRELAPTVDELAERQALYLRLLSADPSLGVGLGQEVAETLLKAGRLDVEAFVRASRAPLLRREKTIQRKQQSLLARIAKACPELAAPIGDLVPSGAPVSATTARVSPPPPATPVFGPGAQLPPPISEPEELIVQLTVALEDAADPVRLERVLAGAVRLSRLPLESRRRMAEPLAKRAKELAVGWPSPFTGGDVRTMLAAVAYTWATGTKIGGGWPQQQSMQDFALKHSSVDRELKPVTPTGVFAVRAMEAAELIARQAGVTLLAEPTHDRGSIDAAALVERAQATCGGLLGSGPPRYDLEQAVLRVPPEDLGRCLNELPRRVRGGAAQVAHELARMAQPEVVSGRPGVKWGRQAEPVVLAALRSVGLSGSILAALSALEAPLESYRRLSADGEYSTGYGASIRTWRLMLPWHEELVAAHLLRPLSRALHSGKHALGPAAAAGLAAPGARLGPTGHLGLAMACIGAEGDTRTVARDAFAQAAEDGRLQVDVTANAWLALAAGEVFQAKRLEACLQPLSTHPAGTRLAQVLQRALGPLVEMGARDLHVLIRLAVSLSTAYEIGWDDPRLAALAARKGNSELAAAARALLAAR